MVAAYLPLIPNINSMGTMAQKPNNAKSCGAGDMPAPHPVAVYLRSFLLYFQELLPHYARLEMPIGLEVCAASKKCLPLPWENGSWYY